MSRTTGLNNNDALSPDSMDFETWREDFLRRNPGDDHRATYEEWFNNQRANQPGRAEFGPGTEGNVFNYMQPTAPAQNNAFNQTVTAPPQIQFNLGDLNSFLQPPESAGKLRSTTPNAAPLDLGGLTGGGGAFTTGLFNRPASSYLNPLASKKPGIGKTSGSSGFGGGLF